MLSLDSPDWKLLSHAHGSAGNVPSLLQALGSYSPRIDYKSEPYFSLWSSLCHQGETYTASYAAVPHILGLAMAEPTRTTSDYLLLPISIEIARTQNRGPKIPVSLEDDYFSALRTIPLFVGRLDARALDETWCVTCAAGIAVSGNQPTLAEAMLELEGSAKEFLEWKLAQ